MTKFTTESAIEIIRKARETGEDWPEELNVAIEEGHVILPQWFLEEIYSTYKAETPTLEEMIEFIEDTTEKIQKFPENIREIINGKNPLDEETLQYINENYEGLTVDDYCQLIHKHKQELSYKTRNLVREGVEFFDRCKKRAVYALGRRFALIIDYENEDYQNFEDNWLQYKTELIDLHTLAPRIENYELPETYKDTLKILDAESVLRTHSFEEDDFEIFKAGVKKEFENIERRKRQNA